MALFCTTILVVHVATANGVSNMPSISLHNAAHPNLKMPVVGLGTFGYPRGGDPEDWTDSVAHNASLLWYSVGGRRWDCAYDYNSKQGVADAILSITNNYTIIPRSDIFITQKVGGSGGNALGYDNVMEQFEGLLHMFGTDYFDLLLIHWPSCKSAVSQSADPVCQQHTDSYNPPLCRQNTWRALEDIFKKGRAKAIGVSNFEKKHLMDIVNMSSLLPAVNQFEFHGYWHEFGLLAFCKSYNITVNSYAPLGAPDVEANGFYNWPYVLTQNPIAIDIGAGYGKSAAQVWLRWAWQQNIVLNPRTLNSTHMIQNMDIFDFELTSDEMDKLSKGIHITVYRVSNAIIVCESGSIGCH